MHRRPFKRGLSPVRTRSQTKRQRLEPAINPPREEILRMEAENRRTYEQWRNEAQDSADRPLLTRYQSADLFADLPYLTPMNNIRLVDQLRRTGSQNTARMLRHTHTPLYYEMNFPDNGMDWSRNLNRCANCGTYATLRQMKHWFNPGYTGMDLAITAGVFPLSIKREQYRRRMNGEPSHIDDVFPRSTYPAIQANQIVPRLDLLDGTMAIPTHDLPAVFVCSARCAEEQIRFNYIRNDRHKFIQRENERTRRSAQSHESYFDTMTSGVFTDLQIS